MKLALICEYFYPDNSGSTPTDLSELTQRLSQQHPELQIDVVTSKNLYRPSGIHGRLAPRENWFGIQIRRLPTPKSNRPSLVLRLLAGTVFSFAALLELLRRPAYDLLLVVTNPPSNALSAWLYSKLRAVPYVYLVHDLYPDVAVALGKLRAGSKLVRMLQSAQKRWLNGARFVVVLGRCMRAHLNTAYGVPASKLSVITSWADPARIHVGSTENEFRRVHGLSRFVVLYAGNFSQYVDFDQIFRAAERLAPLQDLSFVLLGDGARREELGARAQASRGNVRVLSKVPRAAMNEVLAAADVCLISLDPAMLGLGVPSKLYPIMAAGRPAVAMVPAESEIARVLDEEHCGLVVAMGNGAALAEAIRQFYLAPQTGQQMGLRGRSALERRFTLQQVSESFWSVLSAAALSRRPRGAATTGENREKAVLHHT